MMNMEEISRIILIASIIILALMVVIYIIATYWIRVKDLAYRLWKRMYIKYGNTRKSVIVDRTMKILYFIQATRI